MTITRIVVSPPSPVRDPRRPTFLDGSTWLLLTRRTRNGRNRHAAHLVYGALKLTATRHGIDGSTLGSSAWRAMWRPRVTGRSVLSGHQFICDHCGLDLAAGLEGRIEQSQRRGPRRRAELGIQDDP